MPMIRAALALAALACAEPTAVPTDALTTVADESVSSSSFSINTATGTVYVRLGAPQSGAAEAPYAFLHRMFVSADAAGARRLVVDLRGVTGTDARLAAPLVHGIVTRNRFARAGGLIVVTGAKTFSPLQATATLLEQYAAPQFVSDYPVL